MIDLEECFRLRLLRKIKPDFNKSKRSLEIAEVKLLDAEKALNAGIFDLSIVASYTAMFHAARAIMYKDGIQEKSHKCAVIYLKEKYGKTGKIKIGLINSLDAHRIERHEVMYGLYFLPTKEDAEVAIEDAKEFIKIAKKIVELKKSL